MADVTTWLQERRKAIAASIAAVVTIANLWFPDYAGETKKVVASVVLVLGVLGVHGVRNAQKRRK